MCLNAVLDTFSATKAKMFQEEEAPSSATPNVELSSPSSLSPIHDLPSSTSSSSESKEELSESKELIQNIRKVMKTMNGVVYKFSSKELPLTVTCSPNDMSNTTKQYTFKRNYSFNSIESICKYLVHESCELSISSPEKHISLRDKIIDLEQTSTNDFISEDSTWTRFLIAWMVILVQFLCLIAVLLETLQTNVDSSYQWEILITKIFILFYMASEIFEITESLEDTRIGENLLMEYNTENIIHDILSSFGLIYIFIMSLIYFLANATGNSWKSKTETFKLMKSSMNLIIYFLSLITSCIVVKRQDTALDCLFNFSGILVVNSLDEIIFKSFNLSKKLYVLTDELNDDERIKKDLIKKSKLKMAFQRMNTSSFVMLVVIIGCLLF